MDTYADITEAVRAELSLLTPDQVCELLQVNKQWLYDEVQRGNIGHVRLGHRTLRFKPEQIREYVHGERPVRGAHRPASVVASAEPAVRRRPRRNG